MEYIVPLILDLGSRWRRVDSLTHPALPPWEGDLPHCNWTGGWVSPWSSLDISGARKFSCPFWDVSWTLEVKCYVFRTCVGMFLSVLSSVCPKVRTFELQRRWMDFEKNLGVKVTTVAATKFKTRQQFETSVTIYRKRQRDIPEELNLQQHCCENLKSCSHPLLCRRFCTRINEIRERGGVTSKHSCLVSYLLCWRHVSATVGHLQVTKVYIEEKLYRVWS